MYRFVLPAFLAVRVLAAAPAAGAEAPVLPPLLPAACEIELALSAAPEHLRDGARVLVLGAQGFEEARAGDNGFTCLVNRDHPLSLKPTCFDAEGGRTVVPKILLVGELLRRGTPLPEIDAAVDAALAAGTLTVPNRSGVAFMLSRHNHPVDPVSGAIGWFPPHLMFYAPHLTNQDVGAPGALVPDAPYLPFVAYQGPYGFLIVVVGSGDGTEGEDAPACRGALERWSRPPDGP